MNSGGHRYLNTSTAERIYIYIHIYIYLNAFKVSFHLQKRYIVVVFFFNICGNICAGLLLKKFQSLYVDHGMGLHIETLPL